MAFTATRLLSRRYAVTWLYLGLYSLAAVSYAFLSAHGRAELIAWSSTNLANLRRDPAGSLIASAFIPGTPAIAWLVLGSLGLFTVNRLLGNLRMALLLVAGHVAGTMVSEGIVGYQIGHAILPSSARHIVDVGPSYVVVCALVTATLFGSRIQRVAAGAGFAGLATHIFRGLTHLDLTAVGHLTAAAIGAVLGGLLLLSARVADRDPAGRDPADRDLADRDPADRDPADRDVAGRDLAGGDLARRGSAANGQGPRELHPAGTAAYEIVVPTTCPIPNVTATAAAPSASCRSAPYQNGRMVSRETIPPPSIAAIAEIASDTPRTGRPAR